MLDFKKIKPVFFCGHRASGGGVYMSIFDFHPQILVYPHESKFFHLFYPFTEIEDFTPKQKINYMINKNFKFFHSGLFGKCGANKNYFDFKKFTEIFSTIASRKDSWDNYFKAMTLAYSKTTPQKLQKVKYFLDRSSTSEVYAHEINKKFSNSLFIHNIRDPRDNYASLKSRWKLKLKNLSDTDSVEALRQSCISRGKLGFDYGLLNQKMFGKKRYIFTKYDALVKNPKKEIRRLSNFLKIDYNKISYKPTFCGVPWPGNNFDSKEFKNISKSQSGSWINRISEMEAALIEFHFLNLIKKFNFKVFFTPKERSIAAMEHYKWLNFKSKMKADFSLATKADW